MKCYSCGYEFTGALGDNLEEPLCIECKDIRDREGDDTNLTEYYADRFIEIGPKKYKSIKRTGIFHPCSECSRPVYGAPVLIWGVNGKTMVAFCAVCAEEHVYPYIEESKLT